METLLARLTPPGKAAIATIAVRGPLAWDITRQLFAPGQGTLPTEPIVGRSWFGKPDPFDHHFSPTDQWMGGRLQPYRIHPLRRSLRQ